MDNEHKLELVETLKSTMFTAATSEQVDEAAYQQARRELEGIEDIWNALPRWVRINDNLKSFQKFIQGEYGTYKERRDAIRVEFEPVTVKLRGTNAIASNIDTKDTDLTGNETPYQKFTEQYSVITKSTERSLIDEAIMNQIDEFDLAFCIDNINNVEAALSERMVCAIAIGAHPESSESELQILFDSLELAKAEPTRFAARILISIQRMLGRGYSLNTYDKYIEALNFFQQTAGSLTIKRVIAVKHLIGLDEAIDSTNPIAASDAILVTPVFPTPKQDKQFQCDIFVIMPFADEFKPIYDDIIVQVGRELNLRVVRGDDFSSNYHIMDEIWFATYNSQIVIADCTGNNANVFYELGIAHTIGKPTIIITQSIESTPFDVQSRRIIHYENTIPGAKQLATELKNSIARILNIS